MITNVLLKDFRGFKSLKIEDLKRINLISGKNNVGKTSILEGIFLLFDHVAPESFMKLNAFRGLPVASEQSMLWNPVFRNLDMDTNVVIEIENDGVANKLCYSKDPDFIPTDSAGAPPDVWNQFLSSAKNAYSLKFEFSMGEYVEEGHFVVSSSGVLRNVNTNLPENQLMELPFVQYLQAFVQNEDTMLTEWFGKLELQGQKDNVITILKELDESITDISTIAINGYTQLYARMNDKLLPLKLAGSGINKLLFMVLSIIENPNSIVLIDEIESGFHYSMYKKVWDVLAKAAIEYDCQIVVTTHSYECIEGAIESMSENDNLDNFCYYRIDKKTNEDKAFKSSGELLKSAIESNMEVR